MPPTLDRTNVVTFLEALGDDPYEVRANLEFLGLLRDDYVDYCPITVLLLNEGLHRVRVGVTHFDAQGIPGSPLPYGVRQFLRLYREGSITYPAT